jgi:O-antigen/teichoic acid export membrane protein
MRDLKEKTIRGGLARLCTQATNFILRLGSLAILARLLEPKDFGLLGMVTAFTGVLSLFRDFGLSSASIQRASVSEEQLSTLFWINVCAGAILALVTFACAPVLAAFYQEPRLVGITATLAIGFLFNAIGVQHSALLQRQMHFTTLALVSTLSLAASTGVAIAGAKAGYGYWALVAMNVTLPLTNTAGLWLTADWLPRMPQRRTGVRSMMRFGGAITLNSLVIYVASNLDKVLLGHFWGVDAVGIYGRAYQLINIPTDNLNSAAGEVAFSALSKLQDDPQRLRNYFLKGYTLILALTIPITMACAVFADDIVFVFLGPKWKNAAAIFRFLAPTTLVFAMANPLGWLLCSLGMVRRSLKMGVVIAPLMIVSYILGLPYGPKGVAIGYSTMMVLWLVPVILWSLHGTVVSFGDIMLAVTRPLASSVVAVALACAVRLVTGDLSTHLQTLVLEISVLVVTYLIMLLFVAGQGSLYLDLARGLKGSSAVEEKALVSTL